jgi:protein required for attachment to host cells
VRDSDILELLQIDRQDVLSLYLDIDGRKPENQGGHPAYLIWVEHALRDALEGLSGEALRLASRSARRIMALVKGRRPQGRGLIVFAAPGVWKAYGLPVPVPNRLRYGPPDLTVAIDILDQFKPYAVLVADHEHARLLQGRLGEAAVVEEARLELHPEDWRSTNGRRPTSTRQFGIGVGRGAQRDTFDARVAARRRQFLADVARATARFMQERGIDRLILCGADDVVGEVRLALPAEARGKIIGTLALESHASVAEIRDRTLAIALDAEQRQDAELVGTLLDRAAQGGAVVGIAPTLDALEQGRALTVVVDRTILVQMPALPALARRHGARLAPVQGAPAEGLRAHDGIGAILRYAVEPATLPSPASTT